MTFRAILWLWLAAATPLALLFFVWRERLRRRIARRFVSERLRGVAAPFRVLRPYTMGIGLAGAMVALAGPQMGFRTVPLIDRESNRVIVIDVSNSMAARDVGTSRLDAAKAIARRLVESDDGRVALVAFEGTASVVSPLTSDTAAVGSLIDSLQPGEIGEAGSDLGQAILVALRIAEGETSQKGDIVLVSDGEDQGMRLAEALRRAGTRQVEVSAILVGTRGGGTIPLPDGVLRDESGEIVTTRADDRPLRRIALSTGGHFLDNPFSQRALDVLLRDREVGAPKQKSARVPIERYQWPLSVALAALLVGSLLNRGAE